VICEIMNDDGTMARLADLVEFGRQHGIKILTIADLIQYRLRKETLVRRAAIAELPTAHGDFRAIIYENAIDHVDHMAIVKGEIQPDQPVLVRVHSECLTGDVLGSLRCDCGGQLEAALHRISEAGEGVVLYMRQQEGRGIGLANKMKAYHLQQTQGLDTVEANKALGLPVDVRDYGVGAQILRDLGVRRMRLLTNNPSKYHALSGYGLQITERVPLQVPADRHNEGYLRTKRDKLGHELELPPPADPPKGARKPPSRPEGDRE